MFAERVCAYRRQRHKEHRLQPIIFFVVFFTFLGAFPPAHTRRDVKDFLLFVLQPSQLIGSRPLNPLAVV